MRILAACSLGGAGHFEPLRPFLDAASRAAHRVLVIGPPSLQPMVDRAGFAFCAGAEPPEDRVAPIREQLPVAPPEEAARLGNLELFGRLATHAMLPGMQATVEEWRPDLILREPCEYASATVALDAGIATAQVAISLAEVEWASITIASPALGATVAESLRTQPYLSRFPASFDPSPFVSTMRYRPADRRAAPDPGEFPDWWPNHRHLPLIYVTFGTVLGYMQRAAGVFRAAIDAVGGLDARVLLTVGHHFHETGQVPDRLPANVHVEAWVEQQTVMRAAEMVVCHGGSGTVLGALEAGVPLIIWPHFADQRTNARRVVSCGAGVQIDHAPDIEAAVGRLRRDPAFRRSAGQVAAEAAAAPTAAEVLEGFPLGPGSPDEKRQL